MYKINKLIEKFLLLIYSIRKGKFNRLKWMFDQETSSLLETLIDCNPEEFRVVIDGGANHGQTSKSMFNIAPNAYIVAVEPLYEIGDAFSHPRHPRTCHEDLLSLAEIYPNFSIIGSALSDKEGEDKFFLTEFDECSSLVLPPTGSISKAFNVKKEFVVETTTIDRIVESKGITKIDLLKLDLQGGEMLALQGALKSLCITRYILIELNLRRIYKDAPTVNEITEFLHERGFLFQRLVREIRTADGSISQCDGLFRLEKNLYN